MLSIVKIDLDSNSDDLDQIDEPFMEEEDDGEYFIKTEPIKEVFHGFHMVPVVYTTRLDDMVVLNSIGLNQHPRELTAKILNESKPILYSYPDHNSGQINKTSFRLLKAKLRKLYDPQMLKIKEEPDIYPVTLDADQNIFKAEESRESNYTSKYSNLLKLCKPLSIVLTKLELQTVSAGTSEVEEMEYLQEEDTRSPAPTTFFNVSGSRLLTNGVMEVYDLYSDEYTVYCTDYKGNLVNCLIDSPDNAFKYHSIRRSAEIELYFKYCCWTKRNEHMQSLYPKVLLYSNYRFMMKPHLCPIDKCICCCRKKDNFAKPGTAFTDDVSTAKKSEHFQEDIELQELEDEMHQKLIQMNKTPRLNTNDWIQSLLAKATTDPPQVKSQNQSSLIEKALWYKPTPKKQTENRSLLTLKQKKTQYGVIIFRNFALDERDVYEINSNGEVQFYTKLICFNNTSRPDVKKLLLKPKAVYDICCWFKRESITSQLFVDKYLHPSAVKFMRNRHSCLSDKCNCCCKPAVVGEEPLTDVPFSPQYFYRPLKTITKPLNVHNANANKTKSNSQTNTKEPKNKHPNILKKTMMSQSKNTKHTKQRPGSSGAAGTTTPRYDDDCEIVAVRPATHFQPLQPKPIPMEQVKVATVVNVPNISNGELSEEVNTTVASILQRFKDVRLTINSNGKVAAALNMPINTLSTVELKVLASILSYAQSQVNLLGLKSEMSLSSFISRSATDNEPDPAKKVEQIKTTQELTSDGNRNTNLSSTNVVGNSDISEIPNNDDTGFKCKTEVNPNELQESPSEPQLELTKLTTDFDAIIPPVQKEKVLNSFTNSTSATKQNFNDSFASFIATQYDGPKNSFVPVITSVFSMKDQEPSGTTLSGDSEGMPTKQPANQLCDAKTFGKSAKNFGNLSKKRKQDIKSKTKPSKRLRVLSPSQLGSLTSHSISEPAEIYNTFCNPVQHSETMEVCGFTPGIPLLANTSFQIVSAGDPNAQHSENRTKPIPVPNVKPSACVSGSSKTLVVGPLNMDSNNDHVPVTVNSFSSAAMLTEEFDAPTIKDEPSDDCILGM